MEWARLWTLDEANEALPRVQEILRECQTVWVEMQRFRQHIQDLHIIHGDALHEPACPDHKEFRGHVYRYDEARGRLHEMMAVARDQGVYIKDPGVGLVDFPSQRGAEVVFLCYRQGEETIASWHPVEGGFAARKAIPDLSIVGGA